MNSNHVSVRTREMILNNIIKLPTSKRQAVLSKLLRYEPDAYDGSYFQSELKTASQLGHRLPEGQILPDAHDIDCEAKVIKCFEFADHMGLDTNTKIRYAKFRSALQKRGWELRLILVNENGKPSEKFTN